MVIKMKKITNTGGGFMLYKIIEATTIEILSKKVNSCMKTGLIPLSGICRGEGSYLYQAMIDCEASQAAALADCVETV
jgi:hypothetical protein